MSRRRKARNRVWWTDAGLSLAGISLAIWPTEVYEALGLGSERSIVLIAGMLLGLSCLASLRDSVVLRCQARESEQHGGADVVRGCRLEVGGTDEPMPGLMRTFSPWQNTECHHCGGSFQFARQHKVTVPINKKLLCGHCDTYAEGFEDGWKAAKEAMATAAAKRKAKKAARKAS